MKIFEKFTEKRRTESAILITTFVEEVGKEQTFFIPLSKSEIQGEKILIDDSFWSSKLNELQNPEPVQMINMISPIFEKGKKSSKVSVKARLKSMDKILDIWLFLPNSKVSAVEKVTEDDDAVQFKISVPEWVYNSAIKNALEYQLIHFWNKDIAEDQKYSIEDFTIL